MTNTVYHESSQTQSPATFNPYLPTIGRIFQVLQDYAPIGTAIQICNRDLARAVGLRSAGGIPALLRRLEAKGHIERITTPQGSLIVVLGDHGIIDRPNSASGCDQTIDDRSEAETPAAPQNRSAMRDRPKNPLYGTQKNLDQEEGTRTPQKMIETSPLYQHLLIKPDMNPSLARKIAANPIGTIADFEADVQIAETLGKNTPIFYTAALWRDGKRVIAPEERYHERPHRGHVSAGTRTRIDSADTRANRFGTTDFECGPVRTSLIY